MLQKDKHSLGARGFTQPNVSSGRRKRLAGFTLTEMLVVLAIMGSLVVVVIWNYVSTEGKFVAENAAREIRIATREAEIWANSSRQFPLNVTPSDAGYDERYDRGFGIRISMTNPNTIILYGGSDTTSYGYTSPADQTVREMALPEGAVVKGLCVTDKVDGSDCDVFGPLNYVTLFFRRPSRAPVINEDTVHKHAKILLGVKGSSENDWYVEIYDSGRVEFVRP